MCLSVRPVLVMMPFASRHILIGLLCIIPVKYIYCSIWIPTWLRLFASPLWILGLPMHITFLHFLLLLCLSVKIYEFFTFALKATLVCCPSHQVSSVENHSKNKIGTFALSFLLHFCCPIAIHDSPLLFLSYLFFSLFRRSPESGQANRPHD